MCEKRGADDSVLVRYVPEGEWRPGEPLLYARDQVGSVVAVVDASGAVAGRLKYFSYGGLTDSEGVLPDFRYAGLVHHQASGLELATYRAYAADEGRWLSRDPWREYGNVNEYSYGSGSPGLYRDPLGLFIEYVDPRLAAAFEAIEGTQTGGALILRLRLSPVPFRLEVGPAGLDLHLRPLTASTSLSLACPRRIRSTIDVDEARSRFPSVDPYFRQIRIVSHELVHAAQFLDFPYGVPPFLIQHEEDLAQGLGHAVESELEP